GYQGDKLHWVGQYSELKSRLIGCTPEQFLARPDVLTTRVEMGDADEDELGEDELGEDELGENEWDEADLAAGISELMAQAAINLAHTVAAQLPKDDPITLRDLQEA